MEKGFRFQMLVSQTSSHSSNLSLKPYTWCPIPLPSPLKYSPDRFYVRPICSNAQILTTSSQEGENYISIRKDAHPANGIKQKQTREEMALTMARVPPKYKKRVHKEGQEMWTPRDVVSRVLALNHWDDIDALLNRWLGRFNRRNFLPLISVSIIPAPCFYVARCHRIQAYCGHHR